MFASIAVIMVMRMSDSRLGSHELVLKLCLHLGSTGHSAVCSQVLQNREALWSSLLNGSEAQVQ